MPVVLSVSSDFITAYQIVNVPVKCLWWFLQVTTSVPMSQTCISQQALYTELCIQHKLGPSEETDWKTFLGAFTLLE